MKVSDISYKANVNSNEINVINKLNTEKSEKIYDPNYVKGMFDRMSKTYGFANYITSFGFTSIWRKQCVNDLPDITKDAKGFDFMSGMGESWENILDKLNLNGHLTAIDISDEMNKKASEHLTKLKTKNVNLLKVDILKNDIPDNSADFIISTFGIKTFNSEQQKKLANEIYRILKPEGAFSLIEISKPNGWVLKGLYMFYLKIVIPLIGKFFLGNAEDYKMLRKYCERFKDSSKFHNNLLEAGLKSNYKKYFYGCATGVYGRK